MKRMKLKPLSTNAELIANRRAPIHKPTQGHRSRVAYSRKNRSWAND